LDFNIIIIRSGVQLSLPATAQSTKESSNQQSTKRPNPALPLLCPAQMAIAKCDNH
jgi:hypothetical protein